MQRMKSGLQVLRVAIKECKESWKRAADVTSLEKFILRTRFAIILQCLGHIYNSDVKKNKMRR